MGTQVYGGRGGVGNGYGSYALGGGGGNPNGGNGHGTGGLFIMCAKGNISGSGTIVMQMVAVATHLVHFTLMVAVAQQVALFG